MTCPSNARLQPIITGCALFDRDRHQVVWGDLWAGGGVYVFNACLTTLGEAAWEHDPSTPTSVKRLSVSMRNCFERRGVIVIPQSALPSLNYDAQVYLNPTTAKPKA